MLRHICLLPASERGGKGTSQLRHPAEPFRASQGPSSHEKTVQHGEETTRCTRTSGLADRAAAGRPPPQPLHGHCCPHRCPFALQGPHGCHRGGQKPQWAGGSGRTRSHAPTSSPSSALPLRCVNGFDAPNPKPGLFWGRKARNAEPTSPPQIPQLTETAHGCEEHCPESPAISRALLWEGTDGAASGSPSPPSPDAGVRGGRTL